MLHSCYKSNKKNLETIKLQGFQWRRTWDSNPRGCYTLLDFQSSSLAARSILQKYLVISDAHLYYHRNKVNASIFYIFFELFGIGATRKTGGSNWGYKPPLLTRASRSGFSLCSSLSVIATLAAPKGAYLTNGSSYSFTLSLSTAISCFSWSLIYFLIVSSLRPTVLT